MTLDQRLAELSTNDMAVAHKRLNTAIKARVKGNYRSGAHSTEELGCEYVSHYSMEAWAKLFNREWTWREDLSLYEQLKVIANNLISKQVEKYVRHREQSEAGKRKIEEYQPPEYFTSYNLIDKQNDQENEAHFYQMYIHTIEQAIKDDPELVRLFNLVREGAAYDDLRLLPEWANKKPKYLYNLTEKLKRRVKAYRKRYPNPSIRNRQ